ncbi:MAG: alpha/beta hydrolase [Pseudonocardiaceae bacterium]|nr:alpha/beta hydrolase [Pseudonocardiaceae bacterium]
MAACRNAVALVVLVTASALLAGCTVGPSDRPPVAVRDAGTPPDHRPAPQPSTSTPPPPAGRYDPTSLPWRDCTGDVASLLGAAAPSRVDCAELTVRGDLSRPGLGSLLQLDLIRAGSGPAPLVVLGEPGGEPGTLRAARLAAQAPPALLDNYTLIGLASRGTGRTDPIDCIPESTRQQLIGARAGALRELLDTAGTAIRTCVQQLGSLLTAIDSAAMADDLEQLRVALDAPVLNLLSLGEASRAVIGYVRRYPESVGRVVLDGAADPTLDDIGSSEAEAEVAERGFDAFAEDCVDRGCPLAPDPRRALTGLLDRLRDAPLVTPELRVTPGIALQAVLETIGAPQRWPELAAALDAARRGDATGITALVAPLISPTTVPGTPPPGAIQLPARFDPGLATRCNDTSTRVPPIRVEQLLAEWRERFPLFGALFAQRLLLCSAWPVPPETPEGHGAAQAPPVLVIATDGDPVTPAAGARRIATELPSAVLVNWEGTAHGAEWRSPCVTDVVTTYLVDAQLPVPGTLCPP